MGLQETVKETDNLTRKEHIQTDRDRMLSRKKLRYDKENPFANYFGHPEGAVDWMPGLFSISEEIPERTPSWRDGEAFTVTAKQQRLRRTSPCRVRSFGNSTKISFCAHCNPRLARKHHQRSVSKRVKIPEFVHINVDISDDSCDDILVADDFRLVASRYRPEFDPNITDEDEPRIGD